tara:strand:- start:6 stop:134 length:129 start_codon:yes stop_codon:yes gene_type:complete
VWAAGEAFEFCEGDIFGRVPVAWSFKDEAGMGRWSKEALELF